MSDFSLDSMPDDSMDLTPLIDAVFMLLIFFIMATTFSKPVLEVALAKAQGAAPKEIAAEKLTVTIDKEGNVLFDDAAVAPEKIEELMKPYPKETPIVFNVDKAAPFEPFVQVLDAAKRQSRSNFVINASLQDTSHEQPDKKK